MGYKRFYSEDAKKPEDDVDEDELDAILRDVKNFMPMDEDEIVRKTEMFDKLPTKNKLEIIMNMYEVLDEHKKKGGDPEIVPNKERSVDEILDEIDHGKFSEVWNQLTASDEKTKSDAEKILEELRQLRQAEVPKPNLKKASDTPESPTRPSQSKPKDIPPPPAYSKPDQPVDEISTLFPFGSKSSKDIPRPPPPETKTPPPPQPPPILNPGASKSKKLPNSWTVFLKDTLKLGSFAGFDIHSEEDLRNYFPRTERGKWLKKQPQELTVKDIPSLLFDYQQLAGEHFMLIEQFQELQKKANSGKKEE